MGGVPSSREPVGAEGLGQSLCSHQPLTVTLEHSGRGQFCSAAGRPPPSAQASGSGELCLPGASDARPHHLSLQKAGVEDLRAQLGEDSRSRG